MRKILYYSVLASLVLGVFPVLAPRQAFIFAQGKISKTYVGAKTCGECHEAQYQTYLAHSKKAKTFARISLMKKYLTDQEFLACLACHTTGYGKPGGFRSESETPDLKNVGCETCHGPGSLHVENGDGRNITKKVSIELCQACHSKDRVASFKFKPTLFGGTH